MWSGEMKKVNVKGKKRRSKVLSRKWKWRGNVKKVWGRRWDKTGDSSTSVSPYYPSVSWSVEKLSSIDYWDMLFQKLTSFPFCSFPLCSVYSACVLYSSKCAKIEEAKCQSASHYFVDTAVATATDGLTQANSAHSSSGVDGSGPREQ